MSSLRGSTTGVSHGFAIRGTARWHAFSNFTSQRSCAPCIAQSSRRQRTSPNEALYSRSVMLPLTSAELEPRRSRRRQAHILESDRTFVYQSEERSHLRQWWWFTVSGEAHRFAPFQPTAEDTVHSVQFRIVSYYRELMARRALVLDQRETWELRRKNLAALKAARRW